MFGIAGQTSIGDIPDFFQSGVVYSSSRSSLHRRSVSPYQVLRFCASVLIWERFRLSSRSIVGSIVSVHAVRGRPSRRRESGGLRGIRSSFGSNMLSLSGWLCGRRRMCPRGFIWFLRTLHCSGSTWAMSRTAALDILLIYAADIPRMHRKHRTCTYSR